MLIRVGLAVTCSVAAFTLTHLKNRRDQAVSENDGGKDEDEYAQQVYAYVSVDSAAPKEEEEEEEVKCVNTVSPSRSRKSVFGSQDGDQLLLPEFEDIFTENLDFPSDVADVGSTEDVSAQKDRETTATRKGGDGAVDVGVTETSPGKEQRTPRTRIRGQRVGSLVEEWSSRVGEAGVARKRLADVLGQNASGSDAEAQADGQEGDITLDTSFTDYVDSLADDAAELIQLRGLVKELQEREIKLEGELLEYYGLQEREEDFELLERELKQKTAQIGRLNAEIDALQEQGAHLQAQITTIQGQNLEYRAKIAGLQAQDTSRGDALGSLKKQLEETRVLNQGLQAQTTELSAKVAAMQAQELKYRLKVASLQAQDSSEEPVKKSGADTATVESLKKQLEESKKLNAELQKQVHSDTGQAKAQLLMLKQKVASLEMKGQDRMKKDLETEKKLQTLKELEVEVVELRRTNKELQHQKREMTVKLATAESEIHALSNITESDLVARAEAETAALRHVNQDLYKQVEGLQMNRFSEVEELVYLRWVNACLRYELRNYKAPPGKYTAMDLNKSLSPKSQERAKQLMLDYAGPDLSRNKEQSESGYDSESSQSTASETPDGDLGYDFSSGPIKKKGGLMKRLKKWSGRSKDDLMDTASMSSSGTHSAGSSPGRSFSGVSVGSKGPLEALMLRNSSEAVEITSYGGRKQEEGGERTENQLISKLKIPKKKPEGPSVAASFQLMSKVSGNELEAYPAFKDRHKLAVQREQVIKEKAEEVAASKRPEAAAKMTPAEVEKRELRKARPPPKPTGPPPTAAQALQKGLGKGIPPPPPPPPGGPPPPPPPPGAPLPPGVPPPPPPPPPGGLGKLQSGNKMQRAPEVVEFYQSLMKRDQKANAGAAGLKGNSADARNSMIGEIENRSAHLLAIKADVETQGEFVQSLATEVRAAVYTNIDDVVAFVNWLDDELSFLVDERAVLKHFDWPEGKADALREAAFEYQDLEKLANEVAGFEDDLRVPSDSSLKKMLASLEKVENAVYGLLRTRDMTVARYKEFSIPSYWLLDSGLIGKIKLSAVRLAQMYMKRVAHELDTLSFNPEKEHVREFLLLQGVRFAFRVHQFAGGFDQETMRAFEELRNRARAPAPSADVEEEEEQQQE